jgi:retinol dehydrogenase 12
MKDKVVLITGATNGIGKVAATELAKQGATVVIVGRSAEKTLATVKEIQEATGHQQQVDYLLADLSSMADVRRLAAEFKKKYSRLDVLINNAGATFTTRQETVDGYEKTFATNHLSYFLLTTELLDLLKASAPSRIVSVSSDAHKVGKFDFEDLQFRNSYGAMGFASYGTSKLGNILFTYELARRLEGTGVTANVLHPGVVATGFGHNNTGFFRFALKLIQRFTGLTPEQGADTIIYLASSPEVEGITGKYWEKRKQISSSTASYNVETAKRLWEVSERLVNAVPEKV